MDGLLVWSLDGVGEGEDDVGEWLGGGGGVVYREVAFVERGLRLSRCRLIVR